jgi:hypothetical protein
VIQYLPIDRAARNGKHHLVKDENGHQWCAVWQNGRWHCGAHPIDDAVRITHYMART